MGLLKAIFSSRNSADHDGTGASPRTPSFNEMSLGTTEEHAAYEAAKNDPAFMNSPAMNPTSTSPPAYGSPVGSGKRGVWQGVFNPGRNFHENMKNVGAQYYDHVEGERGHAPSIWDHVLHSERHRSFDSLDKDKDGFLTADDLARALGKSEDVKQLIQAADSNGDEINMQAKSIAQNFRSF